MPRRGRRAVEALRDTLDRAALAGGIAAFEDHHDLELLVLDPVLKLHQFVLKAEEFAEVDLAVERRLGLMRHAVDDELIELILVHLHFQLLIEAVGDFRLDALEVILHSSNPSTFCRREAGLCEGLVTDG